MNLLLGIKAVKKIKKIIEYWISLKVKFLIFNGITKYFEY